MLKKNRIELVIFVAVLSVAIVKWYFDYKGDKEIESYGGKTVATIVDYYLVGEASFYVKYNYSVNGVVYENHETPNSLFIDCEKDKKCIGRKFELRYSIKNPGICKIILEHEISGVH